MWDASANTGYYTLIIARDSALTNVVLTTSVVGTMWSDPDALPDSQAGSAYYWLVVGCKTGTKCAPLQAADHQFNKKSNQIKLASPIVDDTQVPPVPVRADDVTLNWDDYLATQNAAAGSGTVLATPSQTEAQRYRVQTATDPNFQNIIETRDVDQTTFTSFATTYPEGPVYWRVQAIDGSGNSLAFSDAASGQFEKKSPVPTLVSPASGSTITGNEPFTWSALNYAASYDIEIYKNNDQLGNVANRVVAANVKQIAYSLSKPLAASSQPYTWRVRRTDASGRKGGWSSFTAFTVAGAAPVLDAPAANAVVAPRESVFSWQPVAAAATYRFERRRPGSSTISESQVTSAQAWAPAAALASGAWQWRVTARDASGQDMGTSEWRDFSVIDPPTAVIPPSISGSGQIGTVLSVLAPTWDLPDVQNSYQWLNNGKAIAGETGTLYTVTSGDLGDKLSVKVTGTKLGYSVGTSTSNEILGALGAPIFASSPPIISGIAKVGMELTTTTGTWPGAPKYAYQWLANGTVIKGATGATYKPTLTDANRKVSVQVTATTAGYQPGSATSAPVLIAKMRSTAKVTLAESPIRKSERASITIAVHVDGNPAPTGKVKLYRDKVLLKTFKLTGAMKGALVTKLPRLGKGKFKIWIKYQGNFSTKAAVSPKAVLKVVR
jgi:hypothetical protein